MVWSGKPEGSVKKSHGVCDCVTVMEITSKYYRRYYSYYLILIFISWFDWTLEWPAVFKWYSA